MALIVQKYGGTSVADLERIHNVARRVIKTKDMENDVVVVLSAMAGETDRLIQLAAGVSSGRQVKREYDMLVSSGEQVSISLLAMVLNNMGYKAKSFLGHQIKIITDGMHESARIQKIDTTLIFDELRNGNIVIVAGFQGVDSNNNITTLGRGGSDTSAVAIAAAIKADFCEIYTDVDGVYTTDPHVYAKARKLKKISYEEMLELASAGAKVLQQRSVELAKKYNVPLYVKSSFNDDEGTLVTREDRDMEKEIVSAVTFDKNQAKVTIIHVPDEPGIAARLFMPLSDQNIIVDMIIQNASIEGHTDMTFTVPKGDMGEVQQILGEVIKDIGAERIDYDENISKISIVGVGMKSHSGVASKMFATLANEGINIMMISTSEIKISCVINEKYTELAVRVLHDAFGLEKEE
ncbi:MAG: aspartate kinase [Deltaproteobacteria bacterium]|nr:aspartate kinase [Deltaproteobacteria bacterium]MBN2845673.1 aspartate kinase [Deltaproteobacteria bacterium]